MVTILAHLHLVFTDISNLDRDDNDTVRFTVACKDDFFLNLQRGNFPVSAAMLLLFKAEFWLRELSGTCAQYWRGLLRLLCRMHLNHLPQIFAKHDINWSMRRQSFENIIKEFVGTCAQDQIGLMVLLCRMHLNHLYQIYAEHDINYNMRGQSFENLMKLFWSVNLTIMLLSESQEVTWKKRRSLVRLQRTTGNR